MNEIEVRFMQRVLAVRHARGWSAQKVADRCGVTRAALSAMENRRRNVPLGEAVVIAQALAVPLDDMIRPGDFKVETTIAYEVSE